MTRTGNGHAVDGSNSPHTASASRPPDQPGTVSYEAAGARRHAKNLLFRHSGIASEAAYQGDAVSCADARTSASDARAALSLTLGASSAELCPVLGLDLRETDGLEDASRWPYTAADLEHVPADQLRVGDLLAGRAPVELPGRWRGDRILAVQEGRFSPWTGPTLLVIVADLPDRCGLTVSLRTQVAVVRRTVAR